MCVLYVSFGSNARPRTFGCVAIGTYSVIYSVVQIARIFHMVWGEQSARCFVWI